MPDSSRKHRSILSAEVLEARQLLSTVSIQATGFTGEEVMVVTDAETGDQLFGTRVFETGTLAATRNNTFTFEVDDSVKLTDLRINFVNDFFDPRDKDRNLIVEEIRFNGNRTQMDALNVFSTGTWLRDDGVQSGYGRGNILHANGYFQVADADEIEFDGNVWQTSRPLTGNDARVDSINNELVLSGIAGEDFSISRQIDVQPGQLSVLTVDAWRNVISGSSFFKAGVGAGIDFYDADGFKIDPVDNRSFQINDNATDPSNRIQIGPEFRVPGNATSAFLWVWVEGNDQGTNIPLRLTDLRLEATTVTGDVTPPTALISSTGRPGNNFFVFSVSFRDNLALPADPDVIISSGPIEVIDPDGRVITPTFSGADQFGARNHSVTYLVNGSSIGAPNVLVSGAYEVRLLSETVRDAAGNFAPAQSLGNVGPYSFA